CVQCGASFQHLHTLGRTVIGYHGCSRAFAADLLAGRLSVEQWKMSRNTYDWLGEGIYFWGTRREEPGSGRGSSLGMPGRWWRRKLTWAAVWIWATQDSSPCCAKLTTLHWKGTGNTARNCPKIEEMISNSGSWIGSLLIA